MSVILFAPLVRLTELWSLFWLSPNSWTVTCLWNYEKINWKPRRIMMLIPTRTSSQLFILLLKVIWTRIIEPKHVTITSCWFWSKPNKSKLLSFKQFQIVLLFFPSHVRNCFLNDFEAPGDGIIVWTCPSLSVIGMAHQIERTVVSWDRQTNWRKILYYSAFSYCRVFCPTCALYYQCFWTGSAMFVLPDPARYSKNASWFWWSRWKADCMKARIDCLYILKCTR